MRKFTLMDISGQLTSEVDEYLQLEPGDEARALRLHSRLSTTRSDLLDEFDWKRSSDAAVALADAITLDWESQSTRRFACQAAQRCLEDLVHDLESASRTSGLETARVARLDAILPLAYAVLAGLSGQTGDSEVASSGDVEALRRLAGEFGQLSSASRDVEAWIESLGLLAALAYGYGALGRTSSPGTNDSAVGGPARLPLLTPAERVAVEAIEWALSYNARALALLEDENSALSIEVSRLRVERQELVQTIRRLNERLDACRRTRRFERAGWALLAGVIELVVLTGSGIVVHSIVDGAPTIHNEIHLDDLKATCLSLAESSDPSLRPTTETLWGTKRD